MANFNKVFLMGNLTRDPELRYTPSGMAVASFGLAVNRKRTGKDGQEREETLFVDVTAFARQAEVMSEYLSKGRPVFIEGRLKLDQWKDKESGANRSKLTVVVENFQFVGGPGGGGGGEEGGGYSRGGSRGGSRGQASGRPERQQPESAEAPDDDDIPF